MWDIDSDSHKLFLDLERSAFKALMSCNHPCTSHIHFLRYYYTLVEAIIRTNFHGFTPCIYLYASCMDAPFSFTFALLLVPYMHLTTRGEGIVALIVFPCHGSSQERLIGDQQKLSRTDRDIRTLQRLIIEQVHEHFIVWTPSRIHIETEVRK